MNLRDLLTHQAIVTMTVDVLIGVGAGLLIPNAVLACIVALLLVTGYTALMVWLHPEPTGLGRHRAPTGADQVKALLKTRVGR